MSSREYRAPFEEAVAAMNCGPAFEKDYMFYAHLLSKVSVRFTQNLPAPAGVRFCADHYEMFINHVMFNPLPLIQRLGILKHEMMHILGAHLNLDEMKTRDPEKWNFSTDCAINQFIPRDHLPSGVIYPDVLEKLIGVPVPEKLSAPEYYEIIDKNKKEKGGSSGSGEGEDGSEGHGMWSESFGSEDFRKALTNQMIKDARDGTMRSSGKVPSEIDEWLRINSQEAQINWRGVTKGILGNKRVGKRQTIKRRNRRFPLREDLRGTVKDRKFDLLVVSDVSGSMSDGAVVETLGEIIQMCKLCSVDATMIQVDTNPSKPEKIHKNIRSVNRKACGGTYMTPAIEMAREHNVPFNAVIVMSDGYLDRDDVNFFGTLHVPVIWLIESSGQQMPEMDTGMMRSFKLHK